MQSSAVLVNATFEEILDDLSSRFIINVPEEELASVERISFQVEQAHWFYEDFIRELKPELPSFQLKTFSARIFKHCPLLHQWAHEHERAYADFMQYRFRIPVCGAIILNPNLDKCVLVKGWSSKSGWGFPKGKINQNEEYDNCAIREVLEETGYDVGPLLKKSDYIEITIREQRIRLYIIQGVSEDTQFMPRTRKEISQISWVKLDDLPTYKATEPRPNNGSFTYVKSGPYRFYMVVPFISKLKHFVNQRKKMLRKDNNKKNNNATTVLIPSPKKNNNNSKKPVESSNALKSLLGVNSSAAIPTTGEMATASPAVSQLQPESRPSSNGDMLQHLFASQQQQKPQQQGPNLLQMLQQGTQSPPSSKENEPEDTRMNISSAHRASLVEELLKQQQHQQLQLQQQQQMQQQQQQQQKQQMPLNDNMRRNSLLNALQGGGMIMENRQQQPQSQGVDIPFEEFLH